MIENAVERYLVDHLAPHDAAVTVLLQELAGVDVHWHDFYELVYVISGVARHRLNGQEHTVRAGSIVMLTPADFHEFSAAKHSVLRCYNIVVQPSVVERDLADLLPHGIGWATTVVDDGTFAEADFERLYKESQQPEPRSAPLMTALLRCVLVEVARATESRSPDQIPAAGRRDDDDVRRAIRFVETHFREQITLADAASEARLSANYFSERFRQVTGTSFQAHLQHLRLRFARSLLTSTALSVTEVCLAAGFNDPSHFGRAYRRRYGETPSAARSGNGVTPIMRIS